MWSKNGPIALAGRRNAPIKAMEFIQRGFHFKLFFAFAAGLARQD